MIIKQEIEMKAKRFDFNKEDLFALYDNLPKSKYEEIKKIIKNLTTSDFNFMDNYIFDVLLSSGVYWLYVQSAFDTLIDKIKKDRKEGEKNEN